MKKNFVVHTCLVLLSIFVFPFVISAQEITSDLTLTSDIKDGIVVKSGNVVLDLAGFNISNESSKDTIKIEKGATLTIKGNGTVTNNSNNKAVIYNDGKVVIESGIYSRENTEGNSYYVILNHGEMKINGGTFKINAGISSLIDNGWYTPEENTDGAMAVLTIDGGNFLMENNDKYIKNDDYGVITVNGGEFTMNMPSSAVIGNMGFYSGKEKVTINGGTFNYSGANYAIWDYKWNDSDNSETIVNNGTFNLTNEKAKVTNAQISESNNQYQVIGEENKFVIVNESKLVEGIESASLSDEYISDEELTLINSVIKEEDNVIGYYEINLFKQTNDGLKVGQILETENMKKVTISLPETLEEVKDGYLRNYQVIRLHDNKAEVIEAVDNKDGTISFETDKFSLYTLTYNDTKTTSANENPKTGDNIMLFIVLGAISIVGMGGCLLYLKRR